MKEDAEEITRAARELRREWDSEELWPRIEAALSQEAARERRRGAAARAGAWLTLAAAVAALAAGATVLMRGGPSPATPAAERRLLTERALRTSSARKPPTFARSSRCPAWPTRRSRKGTRC